MEVVGQLHPPAALLPGERAPVHWTGGGVGPGADLEAVKKTEKSHR